MQWLKWHEIIVTWKIYNDGKINVEAPLYKLDTVKIQQQILIIKTIVTFYVFFIVTFYVFFMSVNCYVPRDYVFVVHDFLVSHGFSGATKA